MSRSGLAMSIAELQARGYTVVSGRAVPIDEAFAPTPRERSEFPDPRGSWCIHGVWVRAPQPAFLDKPRERDNQTHIVGYWRSLGCTVLSTSQYRPSKIARGIADLLVFGPPHLPSFWFWETKKPAPEAMPDEQIQFAQHCARTGTLYGVGSASAAVAFSHAVGLTHDSKCNWEETP